MAEQKHRAPTGPPDPRHHGARPPDVVRFACFVIDIPRRTLHHEGRGVVLSPMAFDLLAILLSDPGRVWRRSELLDRLAALGGRGSDGSLTQLVSTLRFALRAGGRGVIRTVRGVGYGVDLEVPVTPIAPATGPRPPGVEASMGARLAAVEALLALCLSTRFAPSRIQQGLVDQLRDAASAGLPTEVAERLRHWLSVMNGSSTGASRRP